MAREQKENLRNFAFVEHYMVTMRRIVLWGVAALAWFICTPMQAQTTKEAEMTAKVKNLIEQMTTQEKIDQLMNATPGIPRLGIKPYNYWGEALHGVARNGRATVFPQPIGLGATFNPELVKRIGNAISDEGRAKFRENEKLDNFSVYTGITYWSPNINIFRDPRWGRGMETYGEDPFLTGTMGTAFTQGLQGSDSFYLKVSSCAKHYAVHSGPERLRHSFDANPSKRDLFETYLPAFKMLVQQGKVESIMGAYNRVYGASASGSKYLLTDILRHDWGFKGHIVSDCGAVTDIFNGHGIAKSEAEAAAIALKSGLNLECGNSMQHLNEALERGLLTEADLDNALVPLLMTRYKLGIMEHDPDYPYYNIPNEVICSKEHAQLAHEAAVQSMVLLKNDNVLPVAKDTKTICVLGPGATDVFYQMGNYYGISNHYSTYLEGIANKVSLGTSITYLQGFQQTVMNANDLDGNTAGGRWADVAIIFLGNSGNTEGEEGDAIASNDKGDRKDIKLPESQLHALRVLSKNHTNKIITVITGGSPVELQEVEELSDAVILAWYSGQEGGNALGDLVFGDADFAGRLPITFPTSVDALPDYEDYSMNGRTYKYMDSKNIQYPFGYGLTYEKANYTQISIDGKPNRKQKELTLHITLSSNADKEINEVCQLYLATPGAGVTTAQQTLIDFKRVAIPAHGETLVEITIPMSRLETVTEDGSSQLLKGTYTLTAAGAAPCERSQELGVQQTSISFKL